MVEFAIVVPVLLMLILGIIQFGIAYHNYVTLADAVRVGARTAAVSRDASDPVGAAEAKVRTAAQDLPGASDPSKLKVVVTSAPWTQGQDVTVSAQYPYQINILGFVVKSGDLSSTTTERVE